MVDQEVTEILAAIKTRVVSAHDASSATPSKEKTFVGRASEAKSATNNEFASVSVLDRTWDRLPPIISNRSGTAANLELWVKRKIKRLFHWFTWEQVNFNAATRQTLIEIIDSLVSYEQQLSEQREEVNQLLSEIRTTREESEQRLELHQRDLKKIQSLLTSQHTELEYRSSALEKVVEEIQSKNSQALEQQKRETQELLTELANEFRHSDERLQDEQRVCFKQLALQLSESQVLQDRARRQLDSRLTRVEKSDEQG